MSGHNKWSTIKHKKGAADAKRGKVFTKIIKEISVAAKLGGGDPSQPRLRTAIDKAKGENMPKDNIERAIKKVPAGWRGVNYEETTYEGYGPGGVAVLVEVMTDNRNRTVSDVRSDINRLSAIPGIGRKTSERLILELKDKVVKLRPRHRRRYKLTALPRRPDGAR